MVKKEKVSRLLTTSDNPFNPFDDWAAWFQKDVELGHNTCALLSRVAGDSGELDDGSLERAQHEIVHYNVSGVHLLVTETEFTALLKAELSTK